MWLILSPPSFLFRRVSTCQTLDIVVKCQPTMLKEVLILDFVAFDFETANSRRSSPCSLALTFVENSQVVDTKYWLIKPEPFEFDDFNIMIHGITPEDVKNASTFDQLWPELFPLMDGKVMVAHNAAFDVSVLRRTLELYDLPEPNIDILCTYRIAQKELPVCGSYRLNILCKSLNIPLENHHDAREDAQACAKMLNIFLAKHSIDTIAKLKKHYSLLPGFCKNGYYKPCRLRPENINDESEVDSDSSEVYIDDDFKDKNFVFTGTLLGMPRAKAQEIVTRGGGNAQNSVTKKTDFLVLGIQDFRRLNGGTISSKMKKAFDMQSSGHPIQIISEDEFINLIDDELWTLVFGSN